MQLLTPLLLGALLAAAQVPDPAARDGLLVEAAVVPGSGTVRFSTEGGALPAETAGKSDPQMSVSVLWTVGAGVAAGVEAANDGGKLAIAGWGVPRGTAPAGPMALALVSFDL